MRPLRRPLALLAATVVAATLAACGGGQDPTVDESSATSAPSSSSSVPAESVPSSDTTAPAGSDTTVATGDTPAPPPTEAPVENVPPPPPGTPTYGPPAAGSYLYRVTAGQDAGQEPVITIEPLSDTAVRLTGRLLGRGQTVADLNFTGNEARLTRLVVDVPVLGRKEFRGDVLFAPLPPAGDWRWSLTSTDNSLTIRQRATADPSTNTVTSVLEASGATITMVITYDLGMRMPVRIETSGAMGNSTSEFVSFTPA